VYSSGYALLTAIIIPGLHAVILICWATRTVFRRDIIVMPTSGVSTFEGYAIWTPLMTIRQTSGCSHKGLLYAQMEQGAITVNVLWKSGETRRPRSIRPLPYPDVWHRF
jgi:hypothetical protein